MMPTAAAKILRLYISYIKYLTYYVGGFMLRHKYVLKSCIYQQQFPKAFCLKTTQRLPWKTNNDKDKDGAVICGKLDPIQIRNRVLIVAEERNRFTGEVRMFIAESLNENCVYFFLKLFSKDMVYFHAVQVSKINFLKTFFSVGFISS